VRLMSALSASDIILDRLDAFQTRHCVFDAVNVTPTYARAYLVDALSNTDDAPSHPQSSARLHQHVGCKSRDGKVAGKRRYGRRYNQFRWLLIGIGAGISGLRQVSLCEASMPIDAAIITTRIFMMSPPRQPLWLESRRRLQAPRGLLSDVVGNLSTEFPAAASASLTA
jgi:hypothetical protein